VFSQGPVGYIPTPAMSHNWTSQNDAVPHHMPPRAHDNATNHRDHLTYLRNRRHPVATTSRPPLPCYVSHMFTGGGPTYADQAGRVWPVPRSGALGGPHAAWPAMPPGSSWAAMLPGHGGPAEAVSKRGSSHGPRPIYRSRSDETLSTISSHASRQRHRGEKQAMGTERVARRTTDRSRNRREHGGPPTERGALPATMPPSDSVPADVAPTADDQEEARIVEPTKSGHVDSSSNPDSGYSAASGAVAKPLAPCSETSSLHSASSSELASNHAGGAGSSVRSDSFRSESVRSDSVASICNSL